MSKQVTVNATRGQVEDFINSILWKDMRRELLMWKKGFVQENDALVDDAKETNPSTASVLLHIGDINGRKKAVNYLLGLPEVFLQILDDNVSEKENETV